MELHIDEALVNSAVTVARGWQDRANQLLTSEEKVIQEQMKRLLSHPLDKVVLTRLIDQSFRSHNNSRVADQVNNVLRKFGVPDFFSSVDKLLIQMFLGLGRHFPGLSIPKMIDKMRQSSSRAIIPGEPDILHAHLKKRKEQNVRMNINHLGEALLGEREALRRLKTYITDLKNPEIEYISIKISTIYSQIHPLAFEHTVNILVERLSQLYDVAMRHYFTRKNGDRVPKFVNLDMEEYRDMEITYQAFTRTLDKEEFKNYSAGIVLQAYLPDSFALQRELTAWAKKRVAAGGAPVKLRIVKGANMEMEMLESAINNWPLATFSTKIDVDANYKRMVIYGMDPDNIRAVHLGVASHNLFELAFAHELGKQRNITDYFYFEMLEGMADHVRRSLTETAHDVLLYAPVAKKEEFINAIAYLIRRLDENTAEENFLRCAPNLSTTSEAWKFQEVSFIKACGHVNNIGDKPHRTQNRSTEVFHPCMGTFHEGEFRNEPDTDWSLPGNRKWAEDIRARWKKSPGDAPINIPIVVNGNDVFDSGKKRECFDPNQYPEKILVASFSLATDEDIDQAVSTAKKDPDGWRKKSQEQRHEILSRVAMELRKARGDLIGSAAANTGKVFTETDVEVSEAIDFAEFYPHSVKTFENLENIRCKGKGVGVVISPWNFPVAIPCGGIVSALAAGNTVVFKPASSAVLTAWVLCQCFWKAGVSKNTLQFVPCDGETTGRRLTTHPDVDFIILTGGTETGLNILKERPDVFLAAETGGKNATIVTSISDRDQAIKNVIHSAFSNSGQKCSATSLLVLEKEVYEDEHFLNQLKDAAESWSVGSAWDFQNKMGPLIHPPKGDLEKAFNELEPGETWVLKSKIVNDNPYIRTPAIKKDVKPGSKTHLTEFFGPLLAIMRADNLENAIEIVNSTGYGLTSGIESLDNREQDLWKSKIKAGNLYVNRGTTGAVTLRQPFGGMGKSSIGPSIKAGGPNYVTQFMDFELEGKPGAHTTHNDYFLFRLMNEWQRELDWGLEKRFMTDLRMIIRAVKNYLYNWESEFSRETDFFHLRGQDNIHRYLPVGKIVIRVHEDDSLFDVFARVAASNICKNETIISIPSDLANDVTAFFETRKGRKFIEGAKIIRCTDDELGDMIPEIDRIRYAAPERVPDSLFRAAQPTGFYVARAKVLPEGRLELLHYTVNQSICDSYHRYGNLGERALI